jgi:hypothetical protein
MKDWLTGAIRGARRIVAAGRAWPRVRQFRHNCRAWLEARSRTGDHRCNRGKSCPVGRRMWRHDFAQNCILYLTASVWRSKPIWFSDAGKVQPAARRSGRAHRGKIPRRSCRGPQRPRGGHRAPHRASTTTLDLRRTLAACDCLHNDILPDLVRAVRSMILQVSPSIVHLEEANAETEVSSAF